MIMNNNKIFSVEYNTRLQKFSGTKVSYKVIRGGKIKPIQPICPKCNKIRYVDNGYHRVQNSIIVSMGLDIRVGQLHCMNCGAYWSCDRELIDAFIQKEKEFVKSLMLGCVRAGISFERASTVIGESTCPHYSSQYLYELYVESLSQIKVEKFSTASGVYYYDEQFLTVNGNEVCRLTIKDAITRKIILDVQMENAQKGTIKNALHDALAGLPVEAFIIDMDPKYPGIIKGLFPKAKIQWCIFHLYKLLWKELHDEYGKKIPFEQLYNIYVLFDIFFDHSLELEKLKEIINEYEHMKTNDSKSDKELEKALYREFSDYVRSLKKERRRKHQRIPRRTLEQSNQKFNQIKQMNALYPKQLQKRIQFIEENWEKFTMFQHDARVQPTTNGIEHYFAATLAKTDKKDFRSKNAVTRELTACKAEWNGYAIFSKTTLAEVLCLAGLLFLAFPP